MLKNLLLPSICLIACVASQSLAAKPAFELTGHAQSVISVAFSRDGSKIASIGDDGVMRIWDAVTHKEIASVPGFKTKQNTVRFVPDSRSALAIASDGNLTVIEAATGKLIRTIALDGIAGGANTFDISPEGKMVAVVGSSSVRIVEITTGIISTEYVVHRGFQTLSVAYSADGRRIATAGSDHSVILLDLGATTQNTIPTTVNVHGLAFTRDAKFLFLAKDDHTLQSLNTETGVLKTIVDRMLPITTISMALSGQTLVIGGPAHGPWLVKVADQSLVDPAYDSDEAVTCAAMSTDTRWLVGGSIGGKVYIWATIPEQKKK